MRHGYFGDTECFNAVNATLVYGCFNICPTIPDLGTTHPLPWVGCEKNLETLDVLDVFNAVLQGYILKTVYKHQPTNNNLSFASCLNFVKTL